MTGLLSNSDIVTADYRISAIKICASKFEGIPTGMQLQIGKPNQTTNRYEGIITLGEIGVTEPCPSTTHVKTIFPVPTRNSIAGLNIWYSETDNVSQIEIISATGTNNTAGQ